MNDFSFMYNLVKTIEITMKFVYNYISLPVTS